MINRAISNSLAASRRGSGLSFKPLLCLAAVIMITAGLFVSVLTKPARAAKSSGFQDNRLPQETTGKKREESTKSNQSTPSSAANILIASQDEYYIGLTDVIDVNIQDAPELSASFTVDGSGTIQIHPFNKKLMALGKTPDQLATDIRELLIKEDYLVKPIVNVEIKEYNSRIYYITGAISKPGFYTIKGKVTMLKLLTFAGGLTSDHGAKALITRKKTAKEIEREELGQPSAPANAVNDNQSAPTPTPVSLTTSTPSDLTDAAETAKYYKIVVANVNGLDKGLLEQDIPLEPGDLINIPPLGSFLIGGEVVAPGPYPLKEGTTLKQALTLARGFTPNAAGQKAIIFRGNIVDGKQEEVQVDASAIMNGKKADVYLRADDLIVVPNSKWKSFSNAVIRTLGVQTVSRGVYGR